MKKVTKKQEERFKSLSKRKREFILGCKDLCFEILKKNGGKIMLPTELINSELNFSMYGKHGSVEECTFAGASDTLGELCLFGINEDAGNKVEMVTPGWYDECELIWVAGYLIDYLKGDLRPNNEEE